MKPQARSIHTVFAHCRGEARLADTLTTVGALAETVARRQIPSLTIFQRLPIDTNCSFTSYEFISAENGLLRRRYYYLPFFLLLQMKEEIKSRPG